MSTKENKPGTAEDEYAEAELDSGYDPEDESQPDAVSELLEQPNLLPGESAEAFQLLHDEVHLEMKPTTFFEQLRAQDVVNSVWEANRLRRMSTQIVTNAKPLALSVLLAPYFGHRHDLAAEQVTRLYSGKKEEREKALEVVKGFKITNAHVNAQAYQINSLTIAVMERAIGNRDNLRRSILKEHTRDLKKAEKAKRQQTNATAGPAQATPTVAVKESSAPMHANDASSPANANSANATSINGSGAVKGNALRRTIKRREEVRHG